MTTFSDNTSGSERNGDGEEEHSCNSNEVSSPTTPPCGFFKDVEAHESDFIVEKLDLGAEGNEREDLQKKEEETNQGQERSSRINSSMNNASSSISGFKFRPRLSDSPSIFNSDSDSTPQPNDTSSSSLFGNLTSTSTNQDPWDPFLAARMILEPMTNSNEVQKVVMRKLLEVGVDPDKFGAKARVEELMKDVDSPTSSLNPILNPNAANNLEREGDSNVEEFTLKNPPPTNQTQKTTSRTNQTSTTGRNQSTISITSFAEGINDRSEAGDEDEDEDDDGGSADFAWNEGSGNKKKRKSIRSGRNDSSSGSGGDGGGYANFDPRVSDSGYMGANEEDREYQREREREERDRERELEDEEPPIYHIVRPRLPLSKRPLALIRIKVSKRYRAIRSARARVKEQTDKETQTREMLELKKKTMEEELKKKEMELAELEKKKKPLQRSSKAERRAQALRGGGNAPTKMSLAAIKAARAGNSQLPSSSKQSGGKPAKGESAKQDPEEVKNEKEIDGNVGADSSSDQQQQDQDPIPSSDDLLSQSNDEENKLSSSISTEKILVPIGTGDFDFNFDSPITTKLNLCRKAIELFQSKLIESDVPISNAVASATKSLSKLTKFTETEGGMLRSAVALLAGAKAAAEAFVKELDSDGKDSTKFNNEEKSQNQVDLPRIVESWESKVGEIRLAHPDDLDKYLDKESAQEYRKGNYKTFPPESKVEKVRLSPRIQNAALTSEGKQDSQNVKPPLSPSKQKTNLNNSEIKSNSNTTTTPQTSTSTNSPSQNQNPPPPPPPPQQQQQQQKPPPKMTRRRKANMNNVHHRTNYVPSRLPSSNPHLDSSSNNVFRGPGGEEIPPGLDHPTSSNSLFLNEWCCLFCDYELFYGEPPRMLKACNNRKKVLKARKKAKDRAKEKMNPTTSNSTNNSSNNANKSSTSNTAEKDSKLNGPDGQSLPTDEGQSQPAKVVKGKGKKKSPSNNHEDEKCTCGKSHS